MKICREDLAALRFALFTMEAVRDVTADETKRPLINKAIARTRKVHLLLLSIVNQGHLGITEAVLSGIADDSPLAKSVSLLCKDACDG